MKRLILLSVILLVLGSLGTAKALNDIESNQAKDLAERTATQHDEFDSEEKMTMKGGTVSNTIIAGIIEEGHLDDRKQVNVLLFKDQLDDRKQVNILIYNEEVQGWQSVTIPGKSIEQDSYREGNEASHEKKVWGQVSFDDLEMERGVKPASTELHDWIKDIQAGKADSARKEISVKIQDEDREANKGGKTVGAGQVTEILELTHSKSNQISDEVSAISKRSARKGRNPQTGKEIKIPARSDYGHNGREPEEKEVEMIISDKESGEEYFVHANALIEILDENDVSFELQEGRKGMNAVDVRRTD